jgi:hypothetical protein
MNEETADAAVSVRKGVEVHETEGRDAGCHQGVDAALGAVDDFQEPLHQIIKSFGRGRYVSDASRP